MSESYEDLSVDVKQMLSAEMRAAIHAIRNEVQLIRSQQDLQKNRVDNIEQLFTKQQEENREMLELMRNIKSGMKLTNFLRDAFVWVSGIITSGFALWQILKDHVK